jgi:hypothetical protein
LSDDGWIDLAANDLPTEGPWPGLSCAYNKPKRTMILIDGWRRRIRAPSHDCEHTPGIHDAQSAEIGSFL